MAFKKFTEIKLYSKAGNNITIRSTGYLFVPGGIMKSISNVIPTYAIVFIDDEELRIGLDFKSSVGREDIAVVVNKDKTGFNLNLNPVLNYFGIKRPSKRIPFSPVIDNSMLIINLKSLSCKNNS